jgi:UDP-N-acetyl-D-glucosamine dehydrogenase
VSSTRTAEAVKITENIFRAVNIAMVNELKVIYDAMDIDVWEVIDGAADCVQDSCCRAAVSAASNALA